MGLIGITHPDRAAMEGSLRMNSHDHSRCQEFWNILVCQTSKRRPIGYKELSQAQGCDVHHRHMRPYLDCLSEYCESQGVTNITVIMASQQNRGRPGEYAGYNLDKDRQAVFDLDWSKIDSP